MRDDAITRRHVLGLGAAGLAASSMRRGLAAEVRSRKLFVVETAGLQRFGYPVATILPDRDAVGPFQLTQNGKAVPAQFRSIVGPDGRPAVALDFNASPGPLENPTYIVSWGQGVEPGPEPRGGMRVEDAGDCLRIANGNVLAYLVPKNLLGFLRSVSSGPLEYLRPDSEGLSIRYKDDIHFRAGGFGPNGTPTKVQVIREGPLAIALRFDSTEALRGERQVASSLTMTFPSSKSWVEATWTVEDPEGYVAGLGVDLNLNIEGEPTLVDFGANSTVYGQLRRGEVMSMEASEQRRFYVDLPEFNWKISKGIPGTLTPFAYAPWPKPGTPEGWAHVMDARRCTALAVADYARSSLDLIEVHASGRTKVIRDFARNGIPPARGPKSLTVWFHFVPMPVQVGAATSPQAMLAPLHVAWGET